jgi:hypothetical protein
MSKWHSMKDARPTPINPAAVNAIIRDNRARMDAMLAKRHGVKPVGTRDVQPDHILQHCYPRLAAPHPDFSADNLAPVDDAKADVVARAVHAAESGDLDAYGDKPHGLTSFAAALGERVNDASARLAPFEFITKHVDERLSPRISGQDDRQGNDWDYIADGR